MFNDSGQLEMQPSLTGTMFATPAMQEVMSDRAWLQAMLDFEGALARTGARMGFIPAPAAEAIAGACDAGFYDLAEIAAQVAAAGNPALPVVSRLAKAAGEEGAAWVHWGATSQDTLDTALMLMARRGLDLLLQDLDGVIDATCTLARTHRSTPMAGRTLLQQAAPVSFGLKAAGWLVLAQRTRDRLRVLRHEGLAVQLGGAVGTLAALGDAGPATVERLAEELELPAPELPWHNDRDRIAALAAGLGITAGAMGKIAWDVTLLAQTEVGELTERHAPGRGGSSTLPHKRNPVDAVAVNAAARRATALVPVLLGAMVQEQERAAGAWQAEWDALRELFLLVAAAVANTRALLEGLEVNAARMRANLETTAGLIMAEAVMMALAPHVGRGVAHRLVESACRRAHEQGRHLRDILMEDETVCDRLSPETISGLFEPEGYLGAAGQLIDRAVAGSGGRGA